MDYLYFSAGLLLPWLGGTLWLMFAEARLYPGITPNRNRQAGYGFFLGYAVLSCFILAIDAWAGQVDWAWVMGLLGVFALLGGLGLWMSPGRPVSRPVAEDPLGTVQKILLGVLLAWTLMHLLFAAVEVFSRPVYPWDAWLVWVYRAKAWFLAGALTEMVPAASWAVAAAPEIYTINAPGYPLLPSLVPYWSALGLGRWSETLVNVPVLLAGTAIGLAVYGQCRESGMSRLWAIAACYLLYSIPLFGTHIALAGYADIWMAGFAGLGFIALMRGSVSGEKTQTVLGLGMVALAMLVKNEGVVWFLAALLMQALISFRLRTIIVAVLVIAAIVSAAFSMGVSHVEIPLLGNLGVVNGRLEIPFIGSFVLEVHNVWPVYWANFFLMGSWNILWLTVAASFFLAIFSRTPTGRVQRVVVVFFLIFAATQIFIFGFTDQGIWADTYPAVNRLPLHFVPALVFAALLIISRRLDAAPLPVAAEFRHA